MKELIEKFVKKLEKLEDYYILRQDDEAIIIATKVIIKEHKEFLGNVFQPRTQNIDKELAVFFLILIGKPSLKINKEFIERDLPVLTLNKKQISSKTEDIKQILDQFINDSI